MHVIELKHGMRSYQMASDQTLSYTVTERVNLPGTIAHGGVIIKKIQFKTTKLANEWYDSAKSMSNTLFSVIGFERDN